MGCNISGIVDESKFNNPLPWIGIYVAVASLALSVAMIGDIIRSLQLKCLWFPTKFCSMNATILSILTISIKLSVDLNTPMPRPQDQLTKLSSMVLVCTVIANSMPSIGAMQSQEVFMNITALGILVITLIVNICIQLATGVIYVFWTQHILIMVIMLVLLIILSLTATAVPTTKHYFKQRYTKQHRISLQERWDDNDGCTQQKAKEDLTKYRMMIFTSTPRLVIARSVTTSTSGVICLLSTLIFGEAMWRSFAMPGSIDFCHGESSYSWSTAVVLTTHTIAVAVGTIAPCSRYFMTITSSQFSLQKKSFKEEVKVENYWIDKLLKWKEEPLALKSQRRLWRKIANETKWLLLDICIRSQRTIVVMSKVICLASVVCLSQLLVCGSWCKKKLKAKLTQNGSSISGDESQSDSNYGGAKLDYSNYILYLEGEEELVKHMAKKVCNDIEEIKRKQQPAHLMRLLENPTFSRPFQQAKRLSNSYRIACLVLEESPGCWALPLVTLTGIAVALPKVNHQNIQKLIHGVDEGLIYVRRVESNLYREEDALNVRKAAEIVWLGLDLYNKWFGVSLSNMARQSSNHRDILEGLARLAKGRVVEHKSKNINGPSKDNPLMTPAEIIAANSMHMICQIMLLEHEGRNHKTNEELFQELSSIVAYIMGTCLRRLPEALRMESSANIIYNPVHQRNGLFLLCRIENILNFLQKKPLFTWDTEKMEFADYQKSSNDSSLQSCSLSSDNFSGTATSKELCSPV